jgi:hypothetical protein
MTMLEDLREVVRLFDKLPKDGNVTPSMYADAAQAAIAAVNFFRTHAAQIEQDARDAELWRSFCQIIDDPDRASEESLHAILDDAINIGSGALNLFIADAMAKECGNG